MDKQDELKQQFMQLYTPVHERLARFVQSLEWDKEEARDIVAETVMTALEQFASLRNHDAFLYYLFTIAKRKIYKRTQQKKRTTSLDYFQEEPMGTFNADERINNYLLKFALSKMEEKYREPLVLFELSGFSIREISTFLGLSENGVKSRLGRARIQLSKLLDGNLHEKKSIV